MAIPNTPLSRQRGIVQFAPPDIHDDDIEAVSAAFVDEVRGSLDYYLASSGSTPISRLILTGGGARLGGLAQRLQTMTRVAVEVGTPMNSLQVGRTGLSPEQIAFVEPLAAVPVGLALGVAS